MIHDPKRCREIRPVPSEQLPGVSGDNHGLQGRPPKNLLDLTGIDPGLGLSWLISHLGMGQYL
jgi:hypothetical protein